MILKDRVDTFKKLGVIFSNPESMMCINDTIELAYKNNSWFTADNIKFSLLALAKMLDRKQLILWVQSYNIINQNKRIGVVVPSNIPFVGFYDFLCVLLSGNIFVGKLSSSNNILLPYLSKILIDINPDFKKYIFFEQDLKNIDLLIATGNNNSASYFHSKYSNLKKIIRHNRTSIGVVNGLETKRDYHNLQYDICTYFGLGCRSVSKLFIPKGFDFQKMKAVFDCSHILQSHSDYIDNYRYQKTLYKMNKVDFIDFHNLLLVESNEIESPVSVLYYQYYDHVNDVLSLLNKNSHHIQCVVSKDSAIQDSISFGSAQQPTLYNFPDGMDVMQFIVSH